MLRLRYWIVWLSFIGLIKADCSNSTVSQPKQVDTAAVVVSTIALVVVVALALTGNTLVCVAFYRSSDLRNVTNVFIVSLAVTDVLVSVVSIPVWLVILNSGCLYTGNCDGSLMALWRCLDILFSTASIMNLCAISCDRYVAINTPLKYPHILTKARSLLVVITLWLYSVLISLLNLQRWEYYALFVSIVAFLLPLAIMIFAYSCIFRVALRQARRVQPIRQAFYLRREIKAAKTLAIVMGTFTVCWAPFFVMNLLVFFHKNVQLSTVVTLIIKWLHYGNSALNPVIYTSSNRDFRLKMLRVLPCKLCGGTPSSDLGEAMAQFWSTSFRSTMGRSSSLGKGSAEESTAAEQQQTVKGIVNTSSAVSCL